MRRISYFLFVAVIILTAMFSCQKEENAQPADKESVIVNFYASDVETKTAFGDRTDEGKYPTLWTENDSKVKVSLNYAAAKDASVSPSADFKTATFNASITDDGSGSYTFYALSPASAQYVAYSSDTKSVGIDIPSTQTPSSNSVDESAQILVAKSATTDEIPENVELHFTHAVAYGRMSFSNLNLGDAVVSSVSISASKNIAGRYLYFPEEDLLTEKSPSNTITINTTSVSDIWFACAPVDLSDGGTMQVVITTDRGTFTRDITFPADKGNFEAGFVAKFNVNMQGISIVSPDVYTLVKDQAELTVDSDIIIVSSEENYALSTTQNGNNRAQAGITKTGETIISPSSAVQVIKLVVGNQNNTAAFNVGENYLYSVNGTNYLKSGYLNDAASWKITVTDSGIATIRNYQNTDYYLMYNATSDIFSCYKGTQGSVSIYKLNGSGTSAELFMPELEIPVLTVTTDDAAKSITVSWTDVENATSYDVVCGTKTATVDPGVEIASFTMDDFGTFNVSVTASAEGYESATAVAAAMLVDVGAPVKTYTLTITPSDFNTTSYAANNNTKTSKAVASDESTIDVQWTSSQVYKSSGVMQWKKSEGCIYNNTDLGNVISVTVNSTAGSFTQYIGPASQPTISGTGGYFQVKVGGATGKTESVVIVFEK